MHSVLQAISLAMSVCSFAQVHASPASVEKIRLIQRRAVDPSNLDVLYPVGDQLERGTPVTVQSAAPTPGDVTAVGDGQCSPSLKECLLTGKYCTAQTVAVLGDLQQVSAEIDCVGAPANCQLSKTQSFSVTSSDALTGGLTGTLDLLNSVIKAQANIGWTHTWSDTVTQTTTYGFPVQAGERGYMIFIPYMLETCGSYTQYLDCDTLRAASTYDPMACRQTPYRINSNSNSELAGVYSFCNTVTNKGCG